MERSRGSALISCRASRPSLRGMLRSSRIRPGSGSPSRSEWRPSRRKYSSNSSPSSTKCSSLARRLSCQASFTSMRSSASSSAYRVVMGFPLPLLIVVLLVWRDLCLLRGVPLRQGDDEFRARAGRTLGCDQAAMAVHDLAADRQADSRPFVFAAAVQSLEDLEDSLAIFFVEPDAVVAHCNAPGAEHARHHLRLAFDPDLRAMRRLVELQAVADQVLKQLRHLAAIAPDGGQLAGFHASVRVFDAHFEIRDHGLHYFVQIHCCERLVGARDAR